MRVLPLPDDVDDVAVTDAAAAAGINVLPLSTLVRSRRGARQRRRRRGLLLGYSRSARHRIDEAVAALAASSIRAAGRN